MIVDEEAPEGEAAAGRRVKSRERRHLLGWFLQRRSVLPSVRKCGLPIEHEVKVGVHQVDGDMVGHVEGIGRCGSPWACPVCTPVVREERARDIDRAVSVALLAGFTVLMVSCTVPHSWADTLLRTFGIVRDGHRRTRTGRAWQEFKAAHGYVGSIRAWEMTHGGNGWHPHSHELLIFRASYSKGLVRAVRDHYEATYGCAVERATGKALHARHGIDIRRVRTAPELARYLTKVDGGWGAGLELGRADLKKSNGGINPWGLLNLWHDEGDAAARALWGEYERATYGKRAITWSRGLRLLLIGDDEERSDEEAAAQGPAGDVVLEVVFPASVWVDIRRQGFTALLIEQCEVEARGQPPDG